MSKLNVKFNIRGTNFNTDELSFHIFRIEHGSNNLSTILVDKLEEDSDVYVDYIIEIENDENKKEFDIGNYFIKVFDAKIKKKGRKAPLLTTGLLDDVSEFIQKHIKSNKIDDIKIALNLTPSGYTFEVYQYPQEFQVLKEIKNLQSQGVLPKFERKRRLTFHREMSLILNDVNRLNYVARHQRKLLSKDEYNKSSRREDINHYTKWWNRKNLRRGITANLFSAYGGDVNIWYALLDGSEKINKGILYKIDPTQIENKVNKAYKTNQIEIPPEKLHEKIKEIRIAIEDIRYQFLADKRKNKLLYILFNEIKPLIKDQGLDFATVQDVIIRKIAKSSGEINTKFDKQKEIIKETLLDYTVRYNMPDWLKKKDAGITDERNLMANIFRQLRSFLPTETSSISNIIRKNTKRQQHSNELINYVEGVISFTAEAFTAVGQARVVHEALGSNTELLGILSDYKATKNKIGEQTISTWSDLSAVSSDEWEKWIQQSPQREAALYGNGISRDGESGEEKNTRLKGFAEDSRGAIERIFPNNPFLLHVNKSINNEKELENFRLVEGFLQTTYANNININRFSLTSWAEIEIKIDSGNLSQEQKERLLRSATEVKSWQLTLGLVPDNNDNKKAAHLKSLLAKLSNYREGLNPIREILNLGRIRFGEIWVNSWKPDKEEIIEKYLHEMEAEQIFRRAERMAYYGFFLERVNKHILRERFGVTPIFAEGIVYPPDIKVQEQVNWETIFGNKDICQCEHEQSIFGPAAYIVDVLNWLKDIPANGNNVVNAYEQFNQLRPDIIHLALDDKNTTTTLPYIDLVNELLEREIYDGPALFDAANPENILNDNYRPISKITTGGTSLERENSPEQLQQTVAERVYGKHLIASQGMTLPYDSWLDAGRQWLHSINISLHKMFELGRGHYSIYEQGNIMFAVPDYGLLSVPNGMNRVNDLLMSFPYHGEYINISFAEDRLVQGTGYQIAKVYGQSAAQLKHDIPVLLNVTIPPLSIPGYPSGEKFKIFQEIIDTDFIQSKSITNERIKIAFESASCDLGGNNAELLNVDDAFFKALFQFNKILMLSGWSPPQLDMLLKATGSDIDSDTVNNLAFVTQISELLDISLDDAVKICCGFYANNIFDDSEANETNKHKKRSRVHIKQSPLEEILSDIEGVNNASDGVIRAYSYWKNGDAAPNEFYTFSARKDAIAGAFKISVQDIENIWSKIREIIPNGPKVFPTDLMLLQRVVTVSKVLKLDIAELLSLPGVTRLLLPNDIASILLWVRQYQLRNKYIEDYSLISQILGLQIIDWDLVPGSLNIKNEFGRTIESKLAELLEGLTEARMQDAINLESDAGEKHIEGLINLTLPYIVQQNDHEIPVISKELLSSTDWADFDGCAGSKIFDVSKLEQSSETGIVNNKTSGHVLLFTKQDSFVEITGSNNLSTIDQETVLALGGKELQKVNGKYELKQQRVYIVTVEATGEFNIYIKGKGETNTATCWYIPVQITKTDSSVIEINKDKFRRLFTTSLAPIYKFGQLIERLSISPQDVRYLETNAILGDVDWGSIFSVNATDGEYDHAFERLAQYLRLKESFKGDETYLRLLNKDVAPYIVNGNNVESNQEYIELASAELWIEVSEVLRVVDHERFKGEEICIQGNQSTMHEVYNKVPELLISRLVSWKKEFPVNYSCVPFLLDLRGLQYAVNPAVLDDHALIQKKNAHANLIATIRLYLDENQYLDKSKTIENELRINRRNSLLNYLLSGDSGNQYNSIHDIASHLLAPIEIDVCRSTSRVREAISALHRFIYRCKLGKYTNIRFNSEQIKSWDTFRYSYRVWEANRRVMMYPEEFLLPSLRTKKTPLFEQAQIELEQEEPGVDSAQRTIRNYVQSLNLIGSLEIVSALNHKLTTGEDATILISRTKSHPHKYYFCSLFRDGQQMEWSPWHEITVDIESDGVLPVIHNGKFYLFWLSNKIKTDVIAKEEDPRFSRTGGTNAYPEHEPQMFEVSLNYTTLEGNFDNANPGRLKWAKRIKSKSKINVYITNHINVTNKYDLEEKQHRLHLRKKSGDELEVEVCYWEAIQDASHVPSRLVWSKSRLNKLVQDLKYIIQNHLNYAFQEGWYTFYFDSDNVPNTGVGVVDDIAEIFGDAVMGTPTVDHYNEAYYARLFPDYMYKSEISSRLLYGVEFISFTNALAIGDMDLVTETLGQLLDRAVLIDQGEFVHMTYRPPGSYLRATENVIVKPKSGYSFANIIGEYINDDSNGIGYESIWDSKYRLFTKGKFLVNKCGELHLQEIDLSDINTPLIGSEAHESPETDIYYQRLRQSEDGESNDGFSLWECDFDSVNNQSQEKLFSNTPTKYTLVTQPENLPFRVRKDLKENFVFQDAHRAFIMLPSATSINVLPPNQRNYYSNSSGIYASQQIKYGANDLATFVAYDRVAHRSVNQANKLSSKDKSKANRTSSNSRTMYSAGVKGKMGRIVHAASNTILQYTDNTSNTLTPHSEKYGAAIQQSVEMFNMHASISAYGPIQAAEYELTKTSYKLLPLYHSASCNYALQSTMTDGGIHQLLTDIRFQGYLPWGVYQISQFGYGGNSYNVPNNADLDYSEAEPGVYFNRNQLYANYNQELFFHLPFLIAVHLSNNGKFKESYDWFHYIFDPRMKKQYMETGEEWGYLPFRNESERSTIEQRVDISLSDPFNPHAIADFDPVVYKRAVFYKYIDNIIAWADSHYTKYTGEDIDRAETLYREALNLLGRKPEKINRNNLVSAYSYIQLTGLSEQAGIEFDALGNIAYEDIPPATQTDSTNSEMIQEIISSALMPEEYFCVPTSEKLLVYFKVIEQRLFNLNHCRDINGDLRQIPLFQPPIDPWLLVRARAAGLDLSSVLSYRADTMGYRWQFLYQKAIDYAEFAARMSDKVLTAYEKRDSSELTNLREEHQQQMLKSQIQIRKIQLKDAENTLKQFEKQKAVIEYRMEYYQSRPNQNKGEKQEVEKNISAYEWERNAQIIDTLFAALAAIPQIGIIAGPAGGATTDFGGQHFAQVGRALSSGFRALSAMDRHQSYLAGVSGSRERRRDDWQYQAKSASKELDQLNYQIVGAQIRIHLAEKELENIEHQLEQSDVTLQALQNQFSNTQFYEWQLQESMILSRQAYNLAFDMAKRCEAAYERDTLVSGKNIIETTNWNAEQKGVGSADKLLNQLRRLDREYSIDSQNSREISKRLSISLSLNFPQELAELKTTGTCDLTLKGHLFDIHWPDHYMRRIQSVDISIPCVKGPSTPLNSRLLLRNSYIRVNEEKFSYGTADADNYLENTDDVFKKFTETNGGLNDNGQLAFNNQEIKLRPFEGAGLDHSLWTLELSKDFNYIDFSTISDVILTFEFTARRSNVRSALDSITSIKNNIRAEINEISVLASIRNTYPQQWNSFVQDEENTNDNIVLFSVLNNLTGLDVANAHSPKLYAYYIINNDGFDSVTYEPSSNIYAGLSGDEGEINITDIWGARTRLDGGNDSGNKSLLKDIVLRYVADVSV